MPPADLRVSLEALLSDLGLADVEGPSDQPLTGADFDSLRWLQLQSLAETAGVISEDCDARDLDVNFLLKQLRGIATLAGSDVRPWPIPPEMSGGGFRLQPVTRELVPWLYGLAVSNDVGYRWRYRGAVPELESFARELSSGVLAQFVAIGETTGEPGGHIVAYNADLAAGIAYVGAVFSREHLQSGRPAGAVAAFLRYLFTTWEIRKIYLEVPEFNYGFISSGAGVAFDVEGRLEDHDYYGGRFWDRYILAIRRHHVR